VTGIGSDWVPVAVKMVTLVSGGLGLPSSRFTKREALGPWFAGTARVTLAKIPPPVVL